MKKELSRSFVCSNSLTHVRDFTGDVPPPGAYDPKFDNKVKGLVIEKSDRFLDNKSISSAECSTSITSGKSNATVPIFRVVRIVANFVAKFKSSAIFET